MISLNSDPKPRSTGRRRFAAVACTFAALALSVTVAACGSSGSNGSAGASNQSSNQETSRLKFTACLREHGVTVPQSASGGGARGTVERHPAKHLPVGCESVQQVRVWFLRQTARRRESSAAQ